MPRTSFVAVVVTGLVAALAPSANAATNTVVPFFDPSGGGSSLNVAGCQAKGLWGIPAGVGGSLGSPTPGTTYFYEVTAVVGGVEQAPCGPLPVTINTSAGNNGALMQWNQTPGATAYNVYRNTNPAALQLIAPITLPSAACPVGGPRCTFVDNGLAQNPVSPPATPAPNTQAGAHPDLKIVQLIGYDADVSSDVNETNPHALKTNLLHFPPGLIANARATRDGGGAVSVCKVSDPSGPSLLGDPNKFGTDDPNEDTCPRESLVGTVQTVSRTRTGGGTAITTLTEGDIFNGETLGGEPGRLLIVLRPLCSAGSPVAPGSAQCTAVLGSAALQVEKSYLTARASIVERGGGNYGIDVDTFDIKSGADEPLSPTVDVLAPLGPMGSLVRAGKAPIQVQRLTQTLFGSADQGTAAAGDDLPFMTLPTSCSVKTLSSDATTWVDNTILSGQATFTTTGCPNVPFEPGTTAGVDTQQVEAPVAFSNGTALCPDPLVSGCSTDDDPIHQSHIKSLIATFPRGLNLSAGAGNVIGSLPATIGSVSGFSDELGDLTGSIVLTSVNNDSSGKFAGSFNIEIRVTDTKPNSDTLLVLDGTTSVDQATGQLTTTLDNLPEVPFKNLDLAFNGGPNAALVNPPNCGSHSVTQLLAPHSGEPDETVAASFTTTLNGGACPSPRPFSPNMTMSADPTTGGAFTALTTTITRADRQQLLSGFTLALPPGMLAKLGEFPLCSDAAAGAGTCDDTSKVGTVSISAGTGSSPATLTGKIFLAEPISGSGDVASLVVVVPAVVGPFNLGTVVSRAGLDITFSEGQVVVTTTGSLPAILRGIPVRIQTLTLKIDRANFQHNPSSCVPKEAGAIFNSQGDPTTATTAAEGGATATDTAPFQATNCDALPFAPKVAGTVGGPDQASEGAHPDLDVTITQEAGEASTKKAVVTLPPFFGAAIEALGQSCPENQLLTGTCPAGSFIGTAGATSGLLTQPLGGPVFLVDQPGGLPKLTVLLFGSQGVSLRLDGQIESSGGRLVNTFEGIPDVPLSSFNLHINGGDGGLLQNTTNLCEDAGALDGTFTAYNEKIAQATAPLELLDGSCPRKAKKPKTSLVLSGLGSGKPEMTLKVRRGSDASASLLRRLRLILPKGLSISSYPGNLLGVRAAKKLSRGKLTIGRRKLVVEEFPGNGAKKVKVRFRKGTLKASDRLARQGRAARLTFKLRAKTKGGKKFSFKVKVRPRS